MKQKETLYHHWQKHILLVSLAFFFQAQIYSCCSVQALFSVSA